MIQVKCPACGESIPYEVEYIKLMMELRGTNVRGFCPSCLEEHILTPDGKLKSTGRKFNPYSARV